MIMGSFPEEQTESYMGCSDHTDALRGVNILGIYRIVSI